MTQVLLALCLGWLLLLTLLLAAVVRHVGALQAAGGSQQAPEGGFLFDTDGPWVPSALPPRALSILRARGLPLDDLVVTFFSSRCGPCVERATQLSTQVTDPGTNIFLVTGPDGPGVQNMRSILEPSGALILTDPDAHDVVKSLEINSTPFTVRICDDQIVAKAYVRGVDDYLGIASMTKQEVVDGIAHGSA